MSEKKHESKGEERSAYESSINESELDEWLEKQNFGENSSDDKDDIDPLLSLADDQQTPEASPANNSNKACACKATVLVVDDNSLNLYPLVTILKTIGLTAEKASGG